MTDAPVSLYLDLEPGTAADIEVVASTALAFSAAIKEALYILDPSLQVRVELVSGSPGSLSLNSIIKSIKKAKDEPITIGSATVLLLIWFGAQFAGWSAAELFDHLFKDDPPTAIAELSEEDRQAIAEQVIKALEGRVAEPQVQQVYRELGRDKAIKGVGITTTPGARPDIIVPREAFQTLSGTTPREYSTTKRVVPEDLTVVLVSPVLERGDRRWKLRGPLGEFGAPIKDGDFIERVLTGQTAVPMVTGIEMNIQLETDEELVDGVWVQKERRVMKVTGLRRPPMPAELPFGPKDD